MDQNNLEENENHLKTGNSFNVLIVIYYKLMTILSLKIVCPSQLCSDDEITDIVLKQAH